MKNSTLLPKTVSVETELMHMLPRFLDARRENVRELKASIQNEDWQKISDIGHIMAGICGSFGFDDMGLLGRQIEHLASTKNAGQIATLTEEIEAHLNEVKIIEI